MRIIYTIALSLLLSSCAVELAYVDYDDMYVTKHYDYASNTYRWYQNTRSYVYPYYGNPYPYEMIVVKPIIVVPETNHTYGKRPDRGSLPNHNRNQITPRRGRN